MYIGDLSKRTGASRKAIYLYEELGLIPTPRRRGTYRVYAPEVIGMVETIRCAQTLGFTLRELAETLRGASTGQAPSLDDIVEQIDRKRRTLQAQIDAAKTRIGQLNDLRQRLIDAPALWDCEKTA